MKPILVFQTDFTYKEGAVCAMYGVVKSVDRELEIIDGTHEIPQYDIWSASYRLFQSMRFWPAGTIFVSVVDPGVGTPRRACVAQTADGYTVVTPDNGTLTHIAHEVGILAVREIDQAINRLRGKGTEGDQRLSRPRCVRLLRRAAGERRHHLRAGRPRLSRGRDRDPADPGAEAGAGHVPAASSRSATRISGTSGRTSPWPCSPRPALPTATICT